MSNLHRQNLQFTSSQVAEAMATVNRQLASSQTIKAIEAVQRHLASSPTIKAIEAVQRHLATSPTIKVIEAAQRHLATSPTIRAIEAVQRQIASISIFEKAILDRQHASTLISTPRTQPSPVEDSVGQSRVAFTVAGVRKRPNVCVSSKAFDLQSGSFRSSHNATERLRLFDLLVTDGSLRHTCRKLFADGHYAIAVERAFICLANLVRAKSGLATQDGAALMRTAFSAQSPTLLLNSFLSKSDRNEQLGYMDLYAGAMTGIRNPRAHEHDMEDDPQMALELLVLANHLIRRLKSATKNGSPSGNSAP